MSQKHCLDSIKSLKRTTSNLKVIENYHRQKTLLKKTYVELSIFKTALEYRNDCMATERYRLGDGDEIVMVTASGKAVRLF